MNKVKITILKTTLDQEVANDGLRPVIMKLEATDEDATINYSPVHNRH